MSAAALLPPDFSLRPTTLGSEQDSVQVHALSSSIPWPYTHATLHQWNRYPQFYCVTHKDAIVAISCVFQQGPVATVGATLTSKDHRKLGLASALIDANIEHCRRQQGQIQSLVLSATEMGAGVYRRKGFKEYGKCVSMQGQIDEAAVGDVGDSSGIKSQLFSSDTQIDSTTWNEIVSLANASMDLDRRQVLEMALLRDRPDETDGADDLDVKRDLLLITQRSSTTNALQGVLCAQPQTDRWCVGPIIASDLKQAQRLIDVALHRHLTGKSVQVDIDVSAGESLQEYLETKHGFEQKFECLLMECVLDGGQSGPARKLVEQTRAGQKHGPRAFSLLDLSFM